MYEIAKLEFSKWLENTDISKLSPYEKTIVGIIIDHFDDIARCGTAKGARAKLMGKYIAALGNKADREQLSMVETHPIKESIKRLKSLSVNNFRGFGVTEKFEFSTQYTFYHGPNGSGKTSLCEAIEYSVLGSVAEASSRGIPLNDYVAHAGKNGFAPPILMCESQNGQIIRFVPSLSTYRFAFIEKNRIVDFSHIGAATEKSQNERIAALFGLTEFRTFVHEFTDSFDKRYIILESDASQKYESKKAALQNKIDQRESLLKTIEHKKDELKALIDSLDKEEVVTSDQAIDYLANPKTGLIPIAVKCSVEHHIELLNEENIQLLKTHIENFLNEIENINRNNKLILSDLSTVNLSALFESVVAVQDTFTEGVCPVCRTPLSSAVKNPFDYAKEELEKLKSIDCAKKSVNNSAKKAVLSIQGMRDVLSKDSVAPLFAELDIKPIEHATLQMSDYKINDSETVGVIVECARKIYSEVSQESLHLLIETYNNAAKNTNKEYEDKANSLQLLYGDISGVSSAIIELEKQVTSLSEVISSMSTEVETLKELAEEIEQQIAFNKKMVEAYERIRIKLVLYMSKLPAKLAANLSEKVREYYNYINRGDADFELIESLKLPVSANEQIKVKMYDGLNQNALQILSEGHVRILGLSILLAKAVHEGMPFIVFDDIVNSIDDDHRDGVASLLITHLDFESMQMILTCHGELFVNSLESYVVDKSKMTRYMFLPADSLEERGVVIKYQDSTIPLKMAHEKYQNGELKDSAAKCRQAVECISGALWKKISPNVGGISIKLRNLQGVPDLRSVVDGLKAATTPKKMTGVETLHRLLEKLTSLKVWNLLNKGTHVDETLPEFSRVEIKELLDLLDLLNDEVKSLKIKPSAV